MKKSANSAIAVYAGTFDPITNGHQDIIERALKVFDKVVVAVGQAPAKTALFSLEERIELIEKVLHRHRHNVKVKHFDGLLVDFVRREGSRVIIRGLRAVSDYEYEAQMAIINRQLARDIETVYLVTSQRCSFISSSIVKDLARIGGDITGLVPKTVAKRLGQVFKQGKTAKARRRI